MADFIMPEPVRAALLEYLAQRPYREVAEGITALMSLEQVEVAPPKDASSEDK